ncbi:MAG: TIGR02646 family protein [Verrucomicrobiales bacterium]|nr:TIGR02646 family protein [Verrucomicrobiales bacterium]
MRHVAPHSEPTELTTARPTLPLDWKRIPRRVKHAIRDRLYVHQFGLCGYCEGSLGELGRHIEHIEPKGGIGGNPRRMFDYSNLIASCQGDTDKKRSAGQDASCGHYKDQYIRTRGAVRLADFISPREAGCDQQFSYLVDGRVVPSTAPGSPNHTRARYTIDAAGLDCTRLRNRRRKIAARLVQQINRFKAQPAILQQLVNHYLSPQADTNGTPVLLPFYSTRQQRFFP